MTLSDSLNALRGIGSSCHGALFQGAYRAIAITVRPEASTRGGSGVPGGPQAGRTGNGRLEMPAREARRSQAEQVNGRPPL
ncbi:hypothetical protein GCM10010182_82220 [Actinomadura cremea]|nr:hypothetical protein GCM10010182_82220 [Actinomadura cremea]